MNSRASRMKRASLYAEAQPKMQKLKIYEDSIIRDPKDLYLLSMAESVPVDYIVSGDKDLTDLNEHAGIPILTYNQLLAKL